MKMSLKCSILVAFALSSFSAHAGIDFKTFQKDRWELWTESSYFAPTGNYVRGGGSFDSMPSGYSYQLINIDFGTRWGMTSKLNVFGMTRVGVAQSKDLLLTRNNSQLNQVLLGADYLLVDSGFKLIPEVSVLVPLSRVDKNSDYVQTSEGALEASGAMKAQFRFSRLLNELKLGFTYRDEGRASLIPYSAKALLEMGTWSLGGGVEGYITASQDTQTAVDRETSSLKVNAKSTIFNVTNPASHEAQAFLRFRKTNFDLNAGLGNTITGANSPSGMRFWANLIYRFKTESSASSPAIEVEKFHEETTDGVDQSPFQIKPDPKVPVRKASPAVDQRKKLQNDLNNTEMTIELKSVKGSKKKKKIQKKAEDE